MASPELWGFKKLVTKPWPIQGAQSAASPQVVPIDVKDYLQKEVIARLLVRVVGTFDVVGAAPGAATGRENPEGLITNLIATTTPSLGVITKENLTARGSKLIGIFDKGFSFSGAALTDAAGAGQAVDFSWLLVFKMPGSVNPIEYGLPLALFNNFILKISCGHRDQLFTGGTPPTWNMNNVNIELWADFDDGVAGQFHIGSEYEQTFPILASQGDFPIPLEAGFLYTHLLFFAERDNVKVNDIINSITLQSAGRIWLPHGDNNGVEIQRWNRETHVNSAAESLTGAYFIPALRDGMYTRSIDCLDVKGEVKLNVTLGGGAVRQVTLRARRIKPLGLKVGQKAA